MNIESLFADPNLLQLERACSEPDRITLILKTAPRPALCPQCYSPSAHLHSRYVRRLADLPWLEVAVRLEVHARRLYCRHVECPQRLFCDRHPAFVSPYARRTLCLNETLRLIGLAAGGEAGARLAIALGIENKCGLTFVEIVRLRLQRVTTEKSAEGIIFRWRGSLRRQLALIELWRR